MDEQYKEYLRTPEWIEKSRRIKQQRKHTCEICQNRALAEVSEAAKNAQHPNRKIAKIARFVERFVEIRGNKDRQFEVHHKTYKNIYHEKDEDLACLCFICHTFITEYTDRRQRSLDEAWELTVETIRRVLAEINSMPKPPINSRPKPSREVEEEIVGLGLDGEADYNDSSDLEDQLDDYFSFTKDYFDTQDEFD